MGAIKVVVSKNSKIYILLGILILLIILMSFLHPNFFTMRNFTSMGFQMAEFGILAIAMSLVILTGGIDLSISFNAMLGGILGVFLMRSMMEYGIADPLIILAGILLILVICTICGMFNGFFVSYVGVMAILVTLGSRSIFEGIGLNLTRGAAVSGFPAPFAFIGQGVVLNYIPMPLIIYLAVIIVVSIFIKRTPWGVSVYMLGSNERATRFSGINTKSVQMRVYMLCGLLAGVAGVVMTSRYNSARTDYGSIYVLQSVSAAVLGGTDIEGGSGTVIGTVIAVAILQVISSGLNIFGVNRNLVDIINGAILITVLTINFVVNRRRRIKANTEALATT
jgi:ribose/xylose/arabinose/galactoside ABC-type transport system permease subunit